MALDAHESRRARARAMSRLLRSLRVPPGARVRLERVDPGDTMGFRDKEEAAEVLEKQRARIGELQERLYAENRRALLVVLQGIDASGKDGTIRSVFRGVHPQGLEVTAFKEPCGEERDHDYLWRVYRRLPSFGNVGVFNRSHYEEVLAARVMQLVPRRVWTSRYDQINRFEALISEMGTRVLKFFLHISPDEQRARLADRLRDPRKYWKHNPADLDTRERWDDYRRAHEDALSRCSTTQSPWILIPADKKWARNAAVASLVAETLRAMDPRFPRRVAPTRPGSRSGRSR